MEFDQRQPGEYERRLGRINQTNQVVANNAILNESGAVVVGQDCNISADVVQKMQKHRLIKPLEEQISLAASLTPKDLYMAFGKVFSSHKEYAKLESACNGKELLKDICKLYGNYPLLIQKLTVLAAERKDYFDKALFCCWIAVLTGSKIGMSDIEIKHLGVAALFQDIGVLYISDELIDSMARDQNVQKMYENHTLLSHACLKAIPDLPLSIAQAALEHHEEPDGLGYPKRKMEADISLLGKMLVVCNQVYEAVEADNSPYPTLGSMIPVLQLYGSLYHREIYYGLIFIMQQGKLSVRKKIKDEEALRELMSQLLINHTLLSSGLREVVNTLDLLKNLKGLPQFASLLSVANAIWVTDSSTGLLAEGLVRWMSHVEEHMILDAADEMQDVFVLQQAFRYQMVRFREALSRTLVKLGQTSSPLNAPLNKSLSRLGQYDGHFNRRLAKPAQAA